jgi:hypothetical protein
MAITILSILLITSISLNLILAARLSKSMQYNHNLAAAAITAIEERDKLKNTR